MSFATGIFRAFRCLLRLDTLEPVRLCRALGAETLFLTNAAGGLDASWEPGTLAMITDHISVLVRNPLIGPNDDEEGVRFPDMTHVYDPELCEVLRAAAKEESIPLKEGVYVQFTGPSYETPAEIRMVKSWGGTIAGMSTVVEAIAARHCGMRVCAVSLISNLAAGISKSPLSEEEVIAAGEAAGPRFERLVKAAVRKM